MGRAEGVLALNAPGRSSAARNAGSGSTWRGRLRRPLATSRRERVTTESLIGKFNLTAGAPASTVWDASRLSQKIKGRGGPEDHSGEQELWAFSFFSFRVAVSIPVKFQQEKAQPFAWRVGATGKATQYKVDSTLEPLTNKRQHAPGICAEVKVWPTPDQCECMPEAAKPQIQRGRKEEARPFST